ncbi:MAG: methionine gamma-lyase family protein, partial [Clostridiales bacterium]|nr:methionine gamma-lyase family protein [Clostridiales bacterium]
MTYDIPKLISDAERELRPVFDSFDEISYARTEGILDAFREFRVDDTMFGSTSGYGYDDKGRDTLDRIFARVLGAEAGFVRHSIANGTHALAIALWALLRPGDVMLAVTGRPYDTLMGVIGLSGRTAKKDGDRPLTPDGSLMDFGVRYDDVPFGEDWRPKVRKYQAEGRLKVVYIQRSRGYADRPTLSADEINAMISEIRGMTGAYVIVDNCYGEFSDMTEPAA